MSYITFHLCFSPCSGASSSSVEPISSLSTEYTTLRSIVSKNAILYHPWRSWRLKWFWVGGALSLLSWSWLRRSRGRLSNSWWSVVEEIAWRFESKIKYIPAVPLPRSPRTGLGDVLPLLLQSIPFTTGVKREVLEVIFGDDIWRWTIDRKELGLFEEARKIGIGGVVARASGRSRQLRRSSLYHFFLAIFQIRKVAKQIRFRLFWPWGGGRGGLNFLFWV